MVELVRALYLGGSHAHAEAVLRHLAQAGYQARLAHLQAPGDLDAAMQAGGWDLALADPAACMNDLPALVEQLAQAHPAVGLILVGERLDPAAAARAVRTGAQDVLAIDELRDRLGLAVAREILRHGHSRPARDDRQAARAAELGYRPVVDTAGGRQVEPEQEAIALSQRRTEQALRESQRMLAMLMGNLPGMAFRCRNDPDWTMEFISDGCLGLTGYRPEDLCHSRTVAYGQIVHPDDRKEVWERVQAALAQRRPYQTVYRIRTSEGSTRWVWEQGCGVCAADGTVQAIEGFATDISERVQAEEALRRSEERYRKLVDLSPDAIYIQRDGRLEFINPAGLKLFGAVEPAQLIGKPILDLVHPECREAVRRRMQAILRKHVSMPLLAKRILRLDGRVAEIEAAATPFDYGDPLAVLVVARDISERQRAEEAMLDRASLRELSHRIIQSQEEERRRLSRELHDEAGQALTAIKLNTELLAKRVPDNLPALKRLAQDTSEVTASLISEMRRIAAALRPAALEDLGLLPTLRWYAKGVEMRYGLRVKLISRGLKGRLDPSFETTVYRIVQEALTNIVRHAHARHAVVRVTCGKGGLDLVIRDDGKGMDPGRIRKGTGLTGIRERAHLFAGTMTLESQAGTGTTLRISFASTPEVRS